MGTLRDKYASFPCYALLLQSLQLCEEGLHIDDHAGSKDYSLSRIYNAGRNQMQFVGDTAIYNCVSCVGTAGEPGYNRCITCKVVYDFSFSLIAPLGADNYNIHFLSFSISALYLAASFVAFWDARPRYSSG